MAQSILFPSTPVEHTFVNTTSVTITHNRGYIPNVQVIVNNRLVLADIQHTSLNEVVVTFVNATTGSIYIG